MSPDRLRNLAILLVAPLLWWGTYTPADAYSSASEEFVLLPVALHASRAANYGIDPFGSSIAPVDISIIRAVLDESDLEPAAADDVFQDVEAQSTPPKDKDRDDEDYEDRPNQPAPKPTEPAPKDNGNGGGNGNGGENGNGGGNGNGGENGNAGGNANGGGNSGGKGKGNGKGKDR